ncbi:TORTIFOLIA1-like protein [Vigna angularis]|uniref:TORTIFOLIA1-like protein n=1 Tax=Phaseolus angularis TaxID=3914 RepID=A0A8T0JLD4_PHAAN|nr:TORTIFOLIA1-like protein [Vigna angularis]
MNSLESRVHGLEMALDEISYDLAVSSGRFSYTDVTDDTCCKLPGTDFLSSKFWKKTEGRYTTSKFSLGNIASTNGVHNGTTNRDGGHLYREQKMNSRNISKVYEDDEGKAGPRLLW